VTTENSFTFSEFSTQLSLPLHYFFSRVSILMRDINIRILSVRLSVCPSRSDIVSKQLQFNIIQISRSQNIVQMPSTYCMHSWRAICLRQLSFLLSPPVTFYAPTLSTKINNYVLAPICYRQCKNKCIRDDTKAAARQSTNCITIFKMADLRHLGF